MTSEDAKKIEADVMRRVGEALSGEIGTTDPGVLSVSVKLTPRAAEMLGVEAPKAKSETMTSDLERIASELDEDNFATNARMVRQAAAETARLTARLATATGVLRAVEWPAYEHLSGEEGECPVCRNFKSEGHETGCALAAALGAEKGA